MIKKIKGIVLTVTPYGDNSKIINLLTEELGLVGIMCKGVKSIRNPLRTKTDRFTLGEFHIDYKEGKLSKLIDIDVIDTYNNIRNDIEKISYATYITELTYQVVKQSRDSNVFNLYIDSLTKLNEGLNPLIITNIIELKYLDYLGVGLNFSSCIKCGSKKNIVTIDPDEGGYICKDCYTNELIFNPKTITMLRKYYLIDIKSITKISIKDDIIQEINNFISKYYDRYTGLYLKSKDFLKTLNKL